MAGILCQSSSPDMEDLVQGLQVQLYSSLLLSSWSCPWLGSSASPAVRTWRTWSSDYRYSYIALCSSSHGHVHSWDPLPVLQPSHGGPGPGTTGTTIALCSPSHGHVHGGDPLPVLQPRHGGSGPGTTGTTIALCSSSHGHVMSMAGILCQSSSPDMEDLVQGLQVQL